ncbi:MAG: S8 family serine peptidase [Anaerolineae bacterium]
MVRLTWAVAGTVVLVLTCLMASGAAAGPVGCELPAPDCGLPRSHSTAGDPTRRLPAKVAPRLLAELESSGEADVLVFVRGRPDLTPARSLSTKQEKGRFVVNALRTTAEKTQFGLRRWLDARGVAYQSFWIVNMLRVRADRALALGLAGRPEVKKVDINPRVFGLEPDVGTPPLLRLTQSAPPWGVSDIGAPSVWARGIRGQGIVVAGADTGVDWDHEALKARYRGWDGQSADHNYNWHDAWGKTPLAPSDDHGHGTHTVGTMAGGGPRQIGVAPEARWIACRNMSSGFGTPASYVDCFQFFLAPTDLDGQNPRPDLAADIINNSWACVESEGCHPGDPLWNDTIGPAVEALTAAGIEVVASAGNAGPGCQSVRYPPAIYPQALGVGATQQGGQVAGFSSRGPVTVDGSGLPAPDLAAPGVGVLSSIRGNAYATMSGTSMSGPHVAGAIALLWSAQPQLIAHLAVTEQVLRVSATPISDNQCGGDADGQPNNVYGWGVINADAAVATAESLTELRGTVTDSTGNPLPQAQVTVTDLTWGVEIELATQADGGYSSPLLPSTYRVEADTPSHFAASAVVVVPAGAPLTHDITLAACVDWDGDGRTGLFEVQAVAGDWDNAVFDPAHDLNADGMVNVIDVAVLTTHLDEPCSVPVP